MFLRRVFSRKSNNDSIESSDDNIHKDVAGMPHGSPKKFHRRNSVDDKKGLSVLQLTSLWEHIIRTRKLPDNLDESEMFGEFMERLRDPEWQVRQHALRVLVDVLMVIGQKADNYFEPIVPQLVENLGHPAPTVRKGALDALRIYISETAMPETILLEIMDIGLNQRITTEPFGGRLTCGVILSLPALIQNILHTPKRTYILRSTIEKLIRRIAQVSHQEITLKALLRIRDMIGAREFMEYVAPSDYREFQLLCDIYGLEENRIFVETAQNASAWQSTDTEETPSSVADKVFGSSIWKVPQSSFESNESASMLTNDKFVGWVNGDTLENNDRPSSRAKVLPTWKPSDDNSFETEDFYPTMDDLQFGTSAWKNTSAVNDFKSKSGLWKSPSRETMYKRTSNASNENNNECPEKVIMETEIKINEDTLTMRILESKDDASGSCSDDDGNKSNKVTTPIENSGVIHVLTDSELEETNNLENIDNVMRTPKRVTFGGEIIKMRTPDSDITNSHEMEDNVNNIRNFENLNFLTIDIPNDNTKPIPGSPSKNLNEPSLQKISPRPETQTIVGSASKQKPRPQSTESRIKSGSPSRRFQRISVSPVDDIISPKPVHKEITIMHNLQRSPCMSPARLKRQDSNTNSHEDKNDSHKGEDVNNNNSDNKNEQPSPTEVEDNIKSWEDLNLVDSTTINNLKSGDWRYRSRAINELEEALKPSQNLLLVQPHLDTLLRSLLSSEKHADVAEDKRRVIMNLISRLPLDNLENRTTQIITGLCRHGGAGSNRVLKSLMQRLPPAVILLKLLSEEFLLTKSSKFRENALQMVMYALMTFPSTYFDTKTCVTRAVHAALDRKKRVRQAALDVLAILGQVTSPRIVMDIVHSISTTRDNGDDLYAAVKARLARKQLPNVSPDGSVQYALRIPSPHVNLNDEPSLGADIVWITSGIGSVSPTSLNKRLKFQQPIMTNPYNSRTYEGFTKTATVGRTKPHEILGMGVGVNPVDEVLGAKRIENGKFNRYSTSKGMSINGVRSGIDRFHDSGGVLPGLSMKPGYTGPYRGRVSGPSFSDSSQDGRTSDGTSVDSSDLPTRQFPSRFPAMERTEATRIYINNHSSLNASYPKAAYSMHKKPYNRGTFSQDSFNESSFDESPRPVSHPPPCPKSSILRPPTKKFLYAEKDKPLSNKQDHIHAFGEDDTKQSNGNQAFCEDFVSRKIHSETNSTAGDKMINNNHIENPDIYQIKSSEKPEESRDANDTCDLTSEDPGSHSRQSTPIARFVQEETVPPNTIVENHKDDYTAQISREQTVINITTKDTLSRPQSTTSANQEDVVARPKSVISKESVKLDQNVIDKDEIDKALDSFKVLEEVNCEKPSSGAKVEEHEEHQKHVQEDTETKANIEEHQDAVSPELGEATKEEVEELPTNFELFDETSVLDNFIESNLKTVPSVTKSCDSIFDTSMKADAETKSIGSTDSSSDYQLNLHAQSLDDPSLDPKEFPQVPIKPQYTPLTRKSKTTLFGRNRRISPVKLGTKVKAENFPETLERFDKPKDALHQCVNQLDSPNWEAVMTGLRSMVRLIRHHPTLVEIQMHTVCTQLSKSVKNLRSQVARAACQASGELFRLQNKNLEQECDDLAASLLHRTADTNRFLRADATRSLEAMCDNLSPPKVLHIITTRGAVHQNAVVRTTSSKLLNRLADRLGSDKIFTMTRDNRDKFILTGANLLLEGSLETRSYAKALFKRMSEYPHYNRIIMEVIPPRTYRHIEKTLKSIA